MKSAFLPPRLTVCSLALLAVLPALMNRSVRADELKPRKMHGSTGVQYRGVSTDKTLHGVNDSATQRSFDLTAAFRFVTADEGDLQFKYRVRADGALALNNASGRAAADQLLLLEGSVASNLALVLGLDADASIKRSKKIDHIDATRLDLLAVTGIKYSPEDFDYYLLLSGGAEVTDGAWVLGAKTEIDFDRLHAYFDAKIGSNRYVSLKSGLSGDLVCWAIGEPAGSYPEKLDPKKPLEDQFVQDQTIPVTSICLGLAAQVQYEAKDRIVEGCYPCGQSWLEREELSVEAGARVRLFGF